jgi:hypothetical protein
MKIVIRTVLWLWCSAAAVYVLGVIDAPLWVNLGLGCGGGAALDALITEVRRPKTPKVTRKGYPTTPR